MTEDGLVKPHAALLKYPSLAGSEEEIVSMTNDDPRKQRKRRQGADFAEYDVL